MRKPSLSEGAFQKERVIVSGTSSADRGGESRLRAKGKGGLAREETETPGGEGKKRISR